MNTVTFDKSDFTAPSTEPSNHWCVCSGKVVIGGLFDTKAEATEFARQSMTTHAHLSIHRVGAEVTTWKPIETAPMDGSAILGIYAKGSLGFLPIAVRWRSFHPNAKGKDCFRDVNGHKVDLLTHWMPLPESPNA